MKRDSRTPLRILLGVALSGGMPACSITAMTGDVMSDYAVEHMNPYLLESRDLGMACETGASMGAFLMSFERVTDPPHRAAISAMLAAASCAEETSWQEELRSLRAIFAGRGPAARDARIAEKRAHAVAADRYHRAFRSMVAAYGEPSADCPDLSDDDAILWLLGLLAAVQAVQQDRASGGIVNVPLDVPKKAARGAACLDNARWWGVPDALQAAVWLGIPGSEPAGKDPWPQLEAAADHGVQSGVRLSAAILIQAAQTVGDDARLRRGIRRFTARGESESAPRAGDQHSLLDAMAERQALAASDRLWTEATGHRTPIGSLGAFWDTPSRPIDDDDDDLLDDIGDTP